MIRTTVFVLVCYVFMQKNASSVRLLELRVPSHAAEGQEALLGCQFDMEGDLLYSVKWYKDSREFYRYVPRNKPAAAFFPSAGVDVDMTRSSSNVVILKELTAESSGLYRCEVSGEAPLFATQFKEKYISINLLPASDPEITGIGDRYRPGDRINLNCTSSASRPETQLRWWINGRPVPREHLRGPWHSVAMSRPDATETILQLRFRVAAKHFRDGVINLKCLAMIAPLYQHETELNLGLNLPASTTLAPSDDQNLDNFREISFPNEAYVQNNLDPSNSKDSAATAVDNNLSISCLLITLTLIII